MEVTGRLKVIYDTAKVSDRFQKREFILTTEEQTPYPQHCQFQVTQDKVAVLDNLNEGDEVKVHFNLRGREWNGPQGIKYFNTLEAWRLEKIGSTVVTGTNVVKEATKTEAQLLKEAWDKLTPEQQQKITEAANQLKENGASSSSSNASNVSDDDLPM